MVVCRRPLILVTDLAGLALLAALATAVITIVVMPALKNRGETPRLRQELVNVQQRERKLMARNGAATLAVDTFEQALSEQADAARNGLVDTGTFLEHMAEQCRACAIELKLVQPLASAASSGAPFCSWDVEVRARGSFPNFQRLLDAIEGWSPFVHVDDVNLQGPKVLDDTVCDLSWKVSIKQLPDWIGQQESSP